jgi:hypothetical protein
MKFALVDVLIVAWVSFWLGGIASLLFVWLVFPRPS